MTPDMFEVFSTTALFPILHGLAASSGLGWLFENLIVRPTMNLLIVILAIIPGHNLGLAIILFTILVRILLWPLLKKQLHHTKAMRELQPEIKRIKQESKGDKQKEAALTMELYREREISPFSSLGLVLLQLPILIGLYLGLRRVISDPENILKYAYRPLTNLGYLKELAANIKIFDQTLLGLVDLTRSAVGKAGTYWPAMVVAVGSAVIQYFQSKQLTPDQGDAKSVRQILRDSSKGVQADQTEMNAAVSRFTLLMIPGFILLISVSLPAALPLYWLASGLVAYVQQARILNEDVKELEASVDAKPVKATVMQPKPRNKKAGGKKRR